MSNILDELLTCLDAWEPQVRVVGNVRAGEAEIGESLVRWLRRGDTVELIARRDGDPMPEWICPKGTPCACRDVSK